MSQNLYDNEKFFNLYKELRSKSNSANNLEEKPELLSLLPDLKGKKVLDLGCGYGEWCKIYSEMGASYVKGIDISSKMLEVAKSECSQFSNIEFGLLDMVKLDELNETFDVVVSSLAVHYVEDFEKLCKDVKKILNKDGIFLFSQEHPIFTATKKGVTWQTDIDNVVKGMVVEDYPESGKRNVYWLVENVVKYHRTFSDIINALVKAGFHIVQVKEPTVSDEVIELNKSLARCKHVPDYLFVLSQA